MVYTALSNAPAGFLANAAWMNLYLRDNLNAINSGGGLVTTAMILWWPSAASIPDNWNACDGTFGVIDLRDRIIVGAGSTYAVQAIGGALTAAQGDHTAHVITTADHPAHNIAASPAHGITFGSNAFFVGATPILVTDTHSGGVSTSNAHTSQALTGAHVHTGSPFSILPPYTALTAILKYTPTVAYPAPRTWSDGDIPTAAMFNQDLRDAFNALRQRLLYQSSILLWSGSLAALPTGYQLCDGTNSSPDLRDRFNMSAGLTYSALATGGATPLTIPDHGTHAATQADAHGAHGAVFSAGHGTSSVIADVGSDQSYDFAPHSVVLTGTHGSHSGFGTPGRPHSVHAAITVAPPYIALGYIQLTSAGTYTTPRTWSDGEQVDQARLNTYLRDNEAALYNGQMPIGAIVAWQNSIASIPAGYTHCTGTSGTPDTRDKFVMGAGLTYAVNATGGATSVTPAAHSDHTIDKADAHAVHGITQPPAHPSAGANEGALGTHSQLVSPGTWSHNFTFSTSPAFDHLHTSWDVDAHSAHSSMSLLPPYMALAFIQRTS